MRVKLMDLVQIETLSYFPSGDTITTIRKAHILGRFTDTMQQATTTSETHFTADTTTTRKETLPPSRDSRRPGFFARWRILSFVVVVLAILFAVVRFFVRRAT